MNRFYTVVFATFLGCLSASANDRAAFFEKHIRPALIKHCYECHSEAGKIKGGLLLDRKDGWAKGGDSGPAIVVGDLDESLLIEAIRYTDPDTEMPPKGKLPAELIGHFEQWVKSGAFDPRTEPADLDDSNQAMDIEKGREFWSFQPVRKPKGQVGIDDLVAAKLSQKNLKPNGRTTAANRLRRAKTDLVGLLPTIAELDEFLADPSEQKFAEMVDRWLASRAFGERWGRHWLDLARYADTSGGGRAMALPEAWRFRDFVIDAFAKDLPLDELIKLHIAGDLLPFGNDYRLRERNLIATGFLVLGPHNYENQNKALLDLEIADEQVDTIGRAFLGMTIGCARCHDHKFDPIPTADYYSLAGIFLSTNSVTHSNVSKWHTEPIPPTKEIQEARKVYLTKSTLIGNEISTIKSELAAMGRGSGGKTKSVSANSLPGIVIDNDKAELVGEWQQSDHSKRFVGASYIHDQQMGIGEKAVIFTHRFEKSGKFELRLSYSSSSNRNPKVPVIVGLPGDILKTYIVNQILRPEHDNLFQTIDTFEIEKGDEVFVKISNDTKQNGVVIADAIQFLQAGDVVEPQKVSSQDIAKLEGRLRKAEAELKALKQHAPAIPVAMCAVDMPSGKISDTEIRIRGVEDNLGPKVNRGFLQVASWQEAEIDAETSGRLEFANWVVDPKNPLTSRVLANRIWSHLLGAGIVASPDNFGTTGRLPTHPELLDYLAAKLVEYRWSTKALIREIVLSDVYSRSSSFAEDAREAESDPENHWLWRGNEKFLDAEVMRDAILTISESLDLDAGGPSLPKGFRSEFGYTFTTKKRSVYVPVFRNKGYEMFGLFDFANPNFAVGKRSESTIPTQALFMKNSDFIHQQAKLAANRFLAMKDLDRRGRVVRAYREILGRAPVDAELRLSLQFLESRKNDEQAALAGLIRSLYGCVDFRILR